MVTFGVVERLELGDLGYDLCFVCLGFVGGGATLIQSLQERGHRPELVAFLEMTPATQRNKVLIKEPNWDLKPGVSLLRGFSWGTVLLKFTGEYNREGANVDLGEVAVEYLKRVLDEDRLSYRKLFP